jgi:hypothetical protein
MVQFASTKNSVNGVILTNWGNKVNTFSPVLAYITPDFDNITPLFDLISLFVSFFILNFKMLINLGYILDEYIKRKVILLKKLIPT